MEKHETVRMMTTGKMKDLGSALLQGMLANLIFEVRKIFGTAINPYVSLIADWEAFYDSMGINVDFSDLVIPEKRSGIDRLII
ncbi:MAG: hypothetical protein UW28_C0031G0001, partial [Parcubacteria group bacterium GW2011_GWA2_44_13]